MPFQYILANELVQQISCDGVYPFLWQKNEGMSI